MYLILLNEFLLIIYISILNNYGKIDWMYVFFLINYYNF